MKPWQKIVSKIFYWHWLLWLLPRKCNLSKSNFNILFYFFCGGGVHQFRNIYVEKRRVAVARLHQIYAGKDVDNVRLLHC